MSFSIGRGSWTADLAIAKVLAGRPKDLEDARSLWRIRGLELDAVWIHRTLRLLEEALSQISLVPSFESIRQGGAGQG